MKLILINPSYLIFFFSDSFIGAKCESNESCNISHTYCHEQDKKCYCLQDYLPAPNNITCLRSKLNNYNIIFIFRNSRHFFRDRMQFLLIFIADLKVTFNKFINLLQKICSLRSHILIARFARSSLRSQEWARLGRAT